MSWSLGCYSALFTVPSIVVTSLASFLSFAGASSTFNVREIALFVGFLGSSATIITALQVRTALATIITALPSLCPFWCPWSEELTPPALPLPLSLVHKSAYKFDTMAETFRAAAAEYQLMVTRLSCVCRKDRVFPEEWVEVWEEVDDRMTELMKKMTVFPNRDLVDHWSRLGKLTVPSVSGALLPPWLSRYVELLEDDGKDMGTRGRRR